MQPFCENCPQEGKDDCALPRLSEKLGDILRILGKGATISLSSGGFYHAVYHNPAYDGQLSIFRDNRLAQREQRIADCIEKRQAVSPVETLLTDLLD